VLMALRILTPEATREERHSPPADGLDPGPAPALPWTVGEGRRQPQAQEPLALLPVFLPSETEIDG
jgi:hypothetical protein